MNDLYIRRMEDEDRRRRQLLGRVIGVFIGVAVVLGVVFGIRLGCTRGDPEPAPEPNAPEETATGAPTAPEAAADQPSPELAPTEPSSETTATNEPGPVVAPPPAEPAGDPGAEAQLLAEATQARTKGDLLEARALALRMLEASTQPASIRKAEILLGEIGVELVMSPHAMPQKVEYTVASGDSLAKLAREYGTTVELLQKGNMLRGSMIRVGDRLRIFNGKFSLRVSKADNDLVMYLDDQFFKRYPVGTGQYNRTPVGDFKINDRIPQPTWWRDDGKAIPYGHPDNELGTHWLSLNIRGYGLHGTWEPDTIGKQASAGCVRLANDDIEELYTLLPVGTPVTIVD